MKTVVATIAIAFALFNAPSVGADETHHVTDGKAAAAVLTNAEVRRVDKAGKRITLKHDEIKNLDMPPMTMVFRVKDPAMLDQVKAGDKVKFAAEDVAGGIMVTEIQVAR